MSSTSWEFGYSDDIRLIFIAPLDIHRIVLNIHAKILPDASKLFEHLSIFQYQVKTSPSHSKTLLHPNNIRQQRRRIRDRAEERIATMFLTRGQARHNVGGRPTLSQQM